MTSRLWFALPWLAVVAVGTWLRLWQIDLQILLDDEWHALHRLMHADYGEIFLSFGHADYCIPLTLMFKALAETVGLHGWQMRVLPMLFGLAAVVMLPWLLRGWLQPAERLCLGALIAISPLLVHFSRYARPYALVVLLGFVAVIVLWQWWHHGGRARAAGFFACAVAVAWLHPLTTLYVGAALTCFAAVGLLRWHRGQGAEAFWKLFALGGATTLACSALILPPLLADTDSIAVKAGKHSIELQTLARSWEMVLGLGSPWLAALLAVPVAVGARTLWRRDRAFVLFWLLLTGVAGVIIQLLGPEWIRHPLVLVRYLAISVPVVLALLAIGLVHIAAMTVRPFGRDGCWAAGMALLLIAGLYLAGPLPATYSGINQFTNSVRYQVDYNFDRSVFQPIMSPLETPPFYREVAAAAGEWKVIEAAWHFETHFTPISEFQRAHQLEIEIGMISGLCTDWTAGELDPDDGLDIELGQFVYLSDVLKSQSLVNRLVVFPLSRPFEHKTRSLPDLTACIKAFRQQVGPPWYESEDYVVFKVPASGPEDGA